jgi:RNA polymerase sigma-70 factor (ECF subfamily)
VAADLKNDEEVMRLVALGETDLLEVLVRRHATRLLTFLHRLVGDRHRSEELFQEVFLLVWSKRSTYRYPRSFRNWLFAIAMNVFRQAMRRNRKHLSIQVEQIQPSSDSETPSEHAQAGEAADLVRRAVLLLPGQQRAVVTLRIWEELPYSRIAEIVGCTETTVRSHMHHALASLRHHLRDLVRI